VPRKRRPKSQLPEAVRNYLSKIGRKGGKAGSGSPGGEARAKALTAEERSEAASKAVSARWSRKTKKQRQAAARKLAKARWGKRSR